MATPLLKKRPQEKFSVGLKYTTPDLDDDDEIIDAEVTIDPTVIGELATLGDPVIVDFDTVSQVIEGGLDGKDYHVRFKVTTSKGHIYEDAILVCVRDFS